MQKEIVRDTHVHLKQSILSTSLENSLQMSMNNMNQINKILPQLTTQRTKENEENSLLSLTDQKKV